MQHGQFTSTSHSNPLPPQRKLTNHIRRTDPDRGALTLTRSGWLDLAGFFCHFNDGLRLIYCYGESGPIMPSATLRLIAALRTTRPRLYSASQPLTLCLRCSSSASSTALTPNAQLTNLEARGLLRDVTSRSVHAHLNEAKRTVYLGVDPSAPSLHVGNLLPIMALLHLILAGHRAILLVGAPTLLLSSPN